MSRETLVAQIPDVRDDNVTDVLRAIKNVLQVREGHLGDALDQNVTLRDLKDLKIVQSGTTALTNGTKVPVIITGRLPDGYDPTTDYTTPPAPTGLTITSGMTSIYLTWDGAPIRNNSYTEIWRASVDVLGTAVRIATTATNVFADPVGKTSQTYYYWIRFVTEANVTGPYNQTAGTIGGTGLVGGVDLSPLIITADKIASGAIDLGGAKVTGLLANANMAVITDPTKIADSLIGNTKLADLAVDAAKLANSSVTATKIANLAVGTAAIQTGAITTALIANAAIGSAQIADAAITSAKIANLAVGNAAIQNGAITNAKIGDLAADKITAGNLTAAIGITTGYIAGGVTPGLYPPGHPFFGTGFFLGLNSSVNKFYVGSYAKNILWDGSNLSVTGTISASSATFQGLTITDNSGNVLLSSGGIPYTVVSGLGSLATQNSVSASSVSGLGTLATQNSVSSSQVSGLGALATQNSVFFGSTVKFPDGSTANTGDFVSRLSQITSGNVSTFIAGAAIGEAYIGNLSAAKITSGTIAADRLDSTIITGKVANLTSAQISDAQITTLKLGGEAVTVPRFAEQVSTGVNLNGSWSSDICSVSYTVSGLGGAETARVVVIAVTQAYPTNNTITDLLFGIFADGTLNTSVASTFDEKGLSVANVGSWFVGNGTYTASAKVACYATGIGSSTKSNNNFVTRLIVLTAKR